MVCRRWNEAAVDHRIREGKRGGSWESPGSAEDHIKWQEQDGQAKAAIMFSVLADDLTTVTDAASALAVPRKLLWPGNNHQPTQGCHGRQALRWRFLQDHLSGSHNDWIRLKDRSQQESGELSRTLQALPASNEEKAAFLLISIPSSMGREKVTYEDVRAKLPDISANKPVTGNSKRHTGYNSLVTPRL